MSDNPPPYTHFRERGDGSDFPFSPPKLDYPPQQPPQYTSAANVSQTVRPASQCRISLLAINWGEIIIASRMRVSIW